MAVIILTLLGYLLAKSFVLPLQIIATGAEAIRKRDFEMRLPRLGYDEFGDIARVFNETMVDFEELKVAGIVQEQLLPRLPLSTEKISIAGKSEAIGDVGGDYFDFFTVSAARTAMMIGDVSGQGVGAALIMAMAKACVLQSQALLEKPAELLLNLHKLIKETSQKSEKRFMSAQYVCFNEDDNCGTFTNAGGFPPLLVDPISRTVKEIAGAGPFLGTLKRPRFCEQPFKVEPGQALILYTDGILESFNYREKEEGFDQFRKLVIEAYDIDPEIYCSKILDGCRNLNQSGIVDDKTVVVMLRKTS
jgi:sigma-B regulation protein RsbU (phosphoserine phosphatase)